MKWITKDLIRYLALLGHLGFVIIGNILVCIFIYKVIEKYFLKSTLLFVLLLLLGVASGFYSAYKLIMKK